MDAIIIFFYLFYNKFILKLMIFHLLNRVKTKFNESFLFNVEIIKKENILLISNKTQIFIK